MFKFNLGFYIIVKIYIISNYLSSSPFNSPTSIER